MKQGKVAIIVNSASYDRVAYTLSIASVSAALGKEVEEVNEVTGIAAFLEETGRCLDGALRVAIASIFLFVMPTLNRREERMSCAKSTMF